MSEAKTASRPVTTLYLLVGEDESLTDQALGDLLRRLRRAAAEAPDIPVEEYRVTREDTAGLTAAIEACETPPFLYPLRIVVLRDCGELAAAEQKTLIQALSTKLSTTVLTLVASPGRAPTALAKAVQSLGEVVSTTPAHGRAESEWVAERLRTSSLRFEPKAREALTSHLGEDIARLAGLLDLLLATYGTGARIGLEELEPFLGEAGGLPPFALTDAIDRGDVATALGVLARLLGADRHPLQILANLHRHVEAMLALDGSGVTDEAGAASLLAIKAYPARKALHQGARLGHERIARATALLAEADLGLRGRGGLPERLVLEICVARLAQLVRQPGPPRQARRRAVGR